MKGFPEKVRRDVLEMQLGKCKVLNCYEDIVDFHHCLINNKANRKLYPLFLNSPMNCVGLCRGGASDCHTNRSHLFKITDREAQVYENFLKELK